MWRLAWKITLVKYRFTRYHSPKSDMNVAISWEQFVRYIDVDVVSNLFTTQYQRPHESG